MEKAEKALLLSMSFPFIICGVRCDWHRFLYVKVR